MTGGEYPSICVFSRVPTISLGPVISVEDILRYQKLTQSPLQLGLSKHLGLRVLSILLTADVVKGQEKHSAWELKLTEGRGQEWQAARSKQGRPDSRHTCHSHCGVPSLGEVARATWAQAWSR